MNAPVIKDELKPNVVLGIAAHPDDLDFMASGTMAVFAAGGAAVYYLVLTDGGKGSEDRHMTSERLKQIRRSEQRSAGKILGLKDVFFRDYEDGTLVNDLDVKREVVRVIRKVKPDVVVSFDPSVIYSAEHHFINHPDHRAAGQAALDSVFPLARDHMAFPELLAEGHEPHKTKTILLSNMEKGNFAVDISGVLDLKFKAIAEHISQTTDMDVIRERFTDRAAVIGQQFGMKYAETFVRIDIG